MSFYGNRCPEMLREIAKCADGWATVTHAKLHSYRRYIVHIIQGKYEQIKVS